MYEGAWGAFAWGKKAAQEAAPKKEVAEEEDIWAMVHPPSLTQKSSSISEIHVAGISTPSIALIFESVHAPMHFSATC